MVSKKKAEEAPKKAKAAPKAKPEATPAEPETATPETSSLDTFIETRLASIAEVARTRGENQTIDLGDCTVTVFQDGVCKVND